MSIDLPVDGCLHCFYFLAEVSRAAVRTPVSVFNSLGEFNSSKSATAGSYGNPMFKFLEGPPDCTALGHF